MALIHIESFSRQTTKSDLLNFLNSVAGMDRQRVGRIDLLGNSAVMEVPDGWQTRLVQALDGQPLGGRRVRVWAEGPADAENSGEDHFARFIRLLDMESRTEARAAAERGRKISAAEAERAGNTLVNLVIADEDSGLGGRHILQLAKRNCAPLPWTRLGVGSPVVLSRDKGNSADGYHGVVCERANGFLRVALTRMLENTDGDETWRLDLSTDEIAGQRQRAALQRARLAKADRLAELRDVLLGRRVPEFASKRDEPALDSELNDAQREAVRFALAARDIALIHGPPGTGKTTAVVEVIRGAIRRGDRVLACAPSNLAVDNLFERLLAAGVRAVRLGHPARVMADLRAHTLDSLVEEHQDVRLARKLVKEAMSLFRQAGRYTRAKPLPGERRQTREDAGSLLADARRLETQAVEHILDTADVLCATATALDSDLLGRRRFDLGVIDEACQSTEPGCWIPLQWCNRVVLAGDHFQLPPTVVDPGAAMEGLGVSLFERLMTLHGPSISRMLTVQYRMNRAIMGFSSRELYEDKLQADPSVCEHVLSGLSGVAATDAMQSPVEFLDTAGAGFEEEVEPDGESRLNRQEAALVCRKVQELLDRGVAPNGIAVIVPYAAQVRLLRERLSIPGLEIDSVDGFQGREKEAVAISLVRSNPQGEIGFLADVRRMNVAMTRARRKLLVVGDSATLSAHPFYRRMIEYFEGIGAYRIVWEEDVAP
ncbi:MAG TPA: AAA domain-containing protein [Sedimentisphaerales bacterium]|nr:AAA domain-containing protein [Sedimentisphaerales bacterium]